MSPSLEGFGSITECELLLLRLYLVLEICCSFLPIGGTTCRLAQTSVSLSPSGSVLSSGIAAKPHRIPSVAAVLLPIQSRLLLITQYALEDSGWF